MADNTNTQDQGTVPANSDQATVQSTEATPAKLYATRAEADAAKPADAPKSLRVYEVTKAGTPMGFMLGRGYDPCLAALARRDGYAVSTGQTKEVTKEAVAAKLAEFTDDELKALGLSRKKGR